jgi:hypothetical protein
LARYAVIKKRKLTEAVERLVDKRGYHLVDTKGMAGLELHPVNDSIINKVLQVGFIEDINISENE